jgi:nitrogen fixation/metabolism regulation signal transduction histidine kinase
MVKIEFQSSLKTKMVAYFLLASVIPIILVSWLLYAQAGHYLKENLFSYLTGVSSMKRQNLTMQIRNRKFQMETAAQSLRVLNPLSKLIDNTAEDKADAMGDLREGLERIVSDGNIFEEVYVIDSTGRILISTKTENERKDVKNMEYFEQGKSDTYFQSFFISPVTNELSLVAASPIKQRDRTFLGVLAGRMNLVEFYKTISDVTGLGETGESYIGGEDKGRVVFLTPTRHDPNSALNIKIKFGDDLEAALQKAVRGADGSGMVKDYRGKIVMASWNYMPDIRWGLVTKMDRGEFEAPMGKWKIYVSFLSLILIGIVGLVAYFFASSIINPIKLLTSAAERISKGDLKLEINTSSKDEIGILAKSFDRMLTAIKFYREEKGGPHP